MPALRRLLAAIFVVALVRASGADTLDSGFRNPPREARVHCYWWWLNGNTDEATITRDLEQMSAKGYGGALLVDANGSDQFGNRGVPAGPMFGSPEWRVLYRHALKEAARLGLEISLNIMSGWNLGGPTVTPAQASKVLTFSTVAVTGPAAFDRVLMTPPEQNGFYRDIAVLAYPLRHGASLPGADNARHPIQHLREKAAFVEVQPFSMPDTTPLLRDFPPVAGEEDARLREVLDLTTHMAPTGELKWDIPPGNWEILRIGYTDSGAKVSTSSGNWQGLAIDYLDRSALDEYWRHNVQPLLTDAGPYLGKSLRYLVTDSWELGGTNWTDKFREEFKTRRGYDLLRFLPVISGRIMEDRSISDRFLNDFRKTIGELIADEHYARFAELAAGYGLGIHPESGGPHGAPIDALRTLGMSTFPQTEFWAQSATHRSRDEDRFFVKEASSAAHIYGKRIVAAEGMTSIGPQWEETIWNDLKPTFDQALCAGLNLIFWHTFTSSPKSAGLPGQEYFAGTHLNPNVTWWNYAEPFISYMSRCQFLMQQGIPVADVVYYYGDHVPNFIRLKAADPAKVLPGYDYDVADEDVLLHRMTVKEGRIALPDGTSYRLLVLSSLPNISLAALRRIQTLVADGATIIGAKPDRTTGLEHQGQGDLEVRQLASQVWGDCDGRSVLRHSYGKGQVVCADSARAELERENVLPDFDYKAASADTVLDYVHRMASGSDIYFIRNAMPRAIYAQATFRIHGRSPELWHADTGEMEIQGLYGTSSDGRTQVPLWLDPYGSVFVVFRRAEGKHVSELSKDGARLFPASTPQDVPRIAIQGQGKEMTLWTGTSGHYEAKFSTGQTLAADVTRNVDETAIEGPWTVRFTPGWGAPEQAVLRSLTSWTDSPDPGVRYFSGTARYTKNIEIPARLLASGQRLYLNLGEVREIAQVTLNGRDLGIVWKKPFEVDLHSAAKPGPNDLEIAVTNLWPNRLIGDQRLPADKRLTHTNILKFRADSPLLPSGLLGPVRLEAVSPVVFR